MLYDDEPERPDGHVEAVFRVPGLEDGGDGLPHVTEEEEPHDGDGDASQAVLCLHVDGVVAAAAAAVIAVGGGRPQH